MSNIQETISKIWKETFNLEDINIDDNFFDLGGTSIQALKVIEKAKANGIIIPFAKMFTCQTIREISEVAYFTNKQSNDISLLMKVVHKINNFIPDENYNHILEEYRSKSNSFNYKLIDDAENIFITGATGYLACHIIEQILLNSNTKIFALVRGSNQDTATQRFWTIFEYYFPNQNYKLKYSNRISIVLGDLTKDNFGLSFNEYETLSKLIDSILHTAGNINHYGIWQDFENININGTKRIIEFAKYNNKKRLNHISTISTSHTYQRSENPIPFTEFDTLENEMAENFYVKSKLIAENLVVQEKNNLDIKIFRPSNIIQSYKTGLFPYGITKDTLFKVNTELTILNILIKNNVMIDLNHKLLDFSYIDETAQSIYKLMTIQEDDGYIYNVFNPHRMSISQFADRLNIKKLPIKDFERYLYNNEDNLIDDIKQLCALTIAEGNVNQSLIIAPENLKTINILKSLGFEWHSLEDKNIHDILSFIQK